MFSFKDNSDMSHICKKQQYCEQLEADLARHKRARQMAVFEITKIKTAIRRMRPNITPHMQMERWLHKVSLSLKIIDCAS